jgi:hypothetical protein
MTFPHLLEDLPAAIWRIAREGIRREKFPPSLRDDPPEEGFLSDLRSRLPAINE